MLRVVVDTNVWLSSLIASGNSYVIKTQFEQGAFQAYLASELLAELREVLTRRKFIERVSREKAEGLLDLLEEIGIFVQLPENIQRVSRDPDDDMYLACAQAGRCNYLVTGDADLLVLKAHGRTRIITPAQFLKVLAR